MSWASRARNSGLSYSPMSLFKSIVITVFLAAYAIEFISVDWPELDQIARPQQKGVRAGLTIKSDWCPADKPPAARGGSWINARLPVSNSDRSRWDLGAGRGQAWHCQAFRDKSQIGKTGTEPEHIDAIANRCVQRDGLRRSQVSEGCDIRQVGPPSAAIQDRNLMKRTVRFGFTWPGSRQCIQPVGQCGGIPMKRIE